MTKYKIGVIGNGNWGTTVAKMIAENTEKIENFDKNIIMWTFKESINGHCISDLINNQHKNEKYLPGITLPINLISRTENDMSDCNILLFCLPHQFIDTIKSIKFNKNAIGISLIKGLYLVDHEILVPSKYIEKISGISCGSLMGPNIASEVAQKLVSESTVSHEASHKDLLLGIFTSDYMKIHFEKKSDGIEFSGALKNVVSFLFGICDGMRWGENTKAIVFRRGIEEIRKIAYISSGCEIDVLKCHCIGDVLASCLGGRNYKFGINVGNKSLDLENGINEEISSGGFLQGPGTAKIIYKWATLNKIDLKEIPLFEKVYKICYENGKVEDILEILLKE